MLYISKHFYKFTITKLEEIDKNSIKKKMYTPVTGSNKLVLFTIGFKLSN